MSLLLWLLMSSVDKSLCFEIRRTKIHHVSAWRQSRALLHAAAAPTEHQQQRAASTSSLILQGLRNRTLPLNGLATPPPRLNLETHLFDPSTGLHSEGVWHNCHVGLASIRLLQLGETDEPTDAAKRIADSLWQYSWDGVSFKRRAHSGLWDHSIKADEQPYYYEASDEHRCIQHGIAVVFWSVLLRYLKEIQDDDAAKYEQQYQTIAESFVSQFWDKNAKRWQTVSATQGGGTVLRKSASANQATLGASSPEPYYRAVDQAIGILACLEILQQNPNSRKTRSILQDTCNELLSTDGFGYSDDALTQSYIGLDRNRNFWHDGWVMLALSCARDQASLSEDTLESLWSRLLTTYGHVNSTTQRFDGTVWHWPTSRTNGNVRYCGDNALMYAISRNQDASGFWDFIGMLQSRNDDCLASVADVYKQVRLHPNTELASLLLWQTPH